MAPRSSLPSGRSTRERARPSSTPADRLGRVGAVQTERAGPDGHPDVMAERGMLGGDLSRRRFDRIGDTQAYQLVRGSHLSLGRREAEQARELPGELVDPTADASDPARVVEALRLFQLRPKLPEALPTGTGCLGVGNLRVGCRTRAAIAAARELGDVERPIRLVQEQGD